MSSADTESKGETMIEPPVRLLFCRHYKPEIEFLKAEGQLKGVSVSFFDGMCGHPPLRWAQLQEAAGVVADPERLMIVGGCCLRTGEPAPVGLSAAKFTRLNNCFKFVAEEDRMAEIRPGDYVVTPGWLGAWRETMAVWGFDKATAQDFFSESSDCVLLLDTGTHADTLTRLHQFSDFIGLPHRVVEVGITTFRERLRSIVGDVRPSVDSALSRKYDSQKTAADYAMALDLMRRIVSMPSLDATVAEIAEVFNAITAAVDIDITYKDHLGVERTFAWGDRPPDSMNPASHRVPSSIDPLPSGKGFVLPLVHAEDNIGFIRIDGIPMADAIDHYMNFALAIAGVCALAIKSKVDQERYAEEKNKSLRQFLDSTRSIPWEFDLVSERFVFVGTQMERITGYPQDYWTDLQSWADTILDEDRARAVNFCRNKTTRGEEHDFVYRMRAKDGSVLWINDVVSVVMGPKGPEKLIGFMHDITAKKHAEEERRASEIRYKELFSNMSEAFAIHEVVLDASGKVVDYTFLDVNPAFEVETGLKKDDIIGKSVKEMLPDEDAFWIDTYGKVAMEGTPVHFSHYSHALQKHYEIFAYSPQFKRFAVLFQDVTEKWVLEEKLRQASKMEAIGTLAGGIAHDFNNILAAIIGFTELAIESLPARSGERGHLQEVMVASNRAKELVRQILAFGRRGEKMLLAVEPRRLVGEAMNLLNSVIPKTVSLKYTLNAKGSFIMADPTEFHQVIMNLCTNAYQALPDQKGTVNVSLDEIMLTPPDISPADGLNPGPYVRLTVEDDGAGMDEATLARIYEPYFTTKPQGKGTGLGLAMVHGIVTGSGGSLTARSALGVGTTITVLLPVTEAPSADKAHPSGRRPASGKATILLVDDESTLVKLGKRMLESLGYTVRETTDPEVGLRLFESDPTGFDMILTDQTMPKMTGVDLIAKARKIRADIKAAICTGHSDLIDEKTAKAQGIAGFIRKPYDRVTLSETVGGLLYGGD